MPSIRVAFTPSFASESAYQIATRADFADETRLSNVGVDLRTPAERRKPYATIHRVALCYGKDRILIWWIFMDYGCDYTQTL